MCLLDFDLFYTSKNKKKPQNKKKTKQQNDVSTGTVDLKINTGAKVVESISNAYLHLTGRFKAPPPLKKMLNSKSDNLMKV